MKLIIIAITIALTGCVTNRCQHCRERTEPTVERTVSERIAPGFVKVVKHKIWVKVKKDYCK